MTKSKPIIRDATAADMRAMFPDHPVLTFKGLVVELDGEVIGIGGVCYQQGHPVAFSDLRDALRNHKKTLAKACRMLVNLFDKIGGRVYAVACPTEPTAPYLLAKLGFAPTGRFTEAGETLVRWPRG